jgi:hypothetical protein
MLETWFRLAAVCWVSSACQLDLWEAALQAQTRLDGHFSADRQQVRYPYETGTMALRPDLACHHDWKS